MTQHEWQQQVDAIVARLEEGQRELRTEIHSLRDEVRTALEVFTSDRELRKLTGDSDGDP